MQGSVVRVPETKGIPLEGTYSKRVLMGTSNREPQEYNGIEGPWQVYSYYIPAMSIKVSLFRRDSDSISAYREGCASQ